MAKLSAFKNLFSLVCLGLLFFNQGCESDPYSVRKASWSLDSGFFGTSKIILSAYELDDANLLLVNNGKVGYRKGNSPNTSIDDGFYLPGSQFPYSSPGLDKNLGVHVRTPNTLGIFSLVNPVNGISFTQENIQPNQGFENSIHNKGYPIIRSRYILAPYQWSAITKTAYAKLIKIKHRPEIGSIQIESVQTLELHAPENSNFGLTGYFSSSYFDQFFLNYNAQFFRVDTVGNVHAYGNSPVQGTIGLVDQMFVVNDTLFAKGADRYFMSVDKGRTWAFFLINNDIINKLKFFNVNKKLYGALGSQLFKIEWQGDGFTAHELDNDGLQTNEITSINQSGKYVYVSTLSGLFFRDSAKFENKR